MTADDLRPKEGWHWIKHKEVPNAQVGLYFGNKDVWRSVTGTEMKPDDMVGWGYRYICPNPPPDTSDDHAGLYGEP